MLEPWKKANDKNKIFGALIEAFDCLSHDLLIA